MLALNRSAIVVRPKLPFLEWLHTVDPTRTSVTLTDLGREPTIYLVTECGDPEAADEYLDRVFHTIFENQLDGWWRDRTTWPTPLSLATFKRWFDSSFTRCYSI
jgi:hypothetical protein